MIGEETGRKVPPVEAATRMRPLRDETGNRKIWKRRVADSSANYELLLEINCDEKKIDHLPAAIACRRDTISAKELTTNFPRCKFLCIFNSLFIIAFHEHCKDKRLCRCFHF